MIPVRKILVLFTAMFMLLTIAVSGAAAQEFTDVDWGEPDFVENDKTSDVTPLDNGTIDYDPANGLLQFRFQNSSDGFSGLDSGSIQIYLDTDQDDQTGLSNDSYTEDYYNNLSAIGADYNVQVGDGQQTLFEWVDTSGGGYFTGRTDVTASRTDSEVLVEFPIDQIGIEEGDQLRLKFAYVEDSNIDPGTYDWAPKQGEKITFTTSGADGESGTIAEHEISGTVDVDNDDGGLTLAPTSVTVTAVTDGGAEADEDTVTINSKSDSGDYSLTVDADNFNGDGGEVQAEFNATRDDFRLNESQTPKEIGPLSSGSSPDTNFTIEPAATVNGTVVVAGTPGLGTDSTANVEFSVAGQTDDVTLDSDTDEQDYHVTAFADELNGGATLTATITNQDATDTDLTLNKTEVESIDLGVGEQQREDFEVQPPQISVSVVPVKNEPIDVNGPDSVEVGVELDNNLGVDVYSISHTLEYDEASLNVTSESDVDFGSSTFADSSSLNFENKTVPSDDNIVKVDITGNASQDENVILYNVTFDIVDSFQNEEGIDFNADGNEVAAGDIVQTSVKAVDENNETIDNFQANTKSIGFTQTKTFVDIDQTGTLLKTKTNMVGSELKVEATAESPNNGDLKNISLINNETGDELDSISCDGATCSTNDPDKSLLTHEPTSGNNTLGGLGAIDRYNLTDKFEVKAYGNGDGEYENDTFDLSATPIYERGDISSATGTEPGDVSLTDLTEISQERGAETDELPWDEDRFTESIYDVNNDGQIDIVDMTIVAREGT